MIDSIIKKYVGTVDEQMDTFQIENKAFFEIGVEDDWFYIHEIFVKSDFRNQGIAKYNLKLIIERAYFYGYRFFEIDVVTDNEEVFPNEELKNFYINIFSNVSSFNRSETIQESDGYFNLKFYYN